MWLQIKGLSDSLKSGVYLPFCEYKGITYYNFVNMTFIMFWLKPYKHWAKRAKKSLKKVFQAIFRGKIKV